MLPNLAHVEFLATHSGPFHADDVCALAVLRTLAPKAHIVRTRDTDTLNAIATSAIIFDVGGAYNPAEGLFDHHQKGRPLREGTDVPYSSFGLIWKHYGADFVQTILDLDADTAQTVANTLDKTLVMDIDAVDNGTLQNGQEPLLHPQSLPALLVNMRPDFDTANDRSYFSAFQQAGDLALTIITAQARSVAAKLRSEKIVEDAIAQRRDPRFIELPCSMNYDDAIHRLGADDILFVINPSGETWQVNTVAQDLGSYGARQDLPAAWAGLRDKDMQKETGVKDAVFCHLARFIAAAKSRDGALELLNLALEEMDRK
jgi:uncharacterized UPF0160 family protein